MEVKDLIQEAESLTDPGAYRLLLSEQILLLVPAGQDLLVKGLKERADQLMRTDIQRSLQVAHVICELSELTGNPQHRAQGLLAEANAHAIVLGNYRKGISLYDEAAAIYEAQGLLVERARSQIGKVFALAQLGRYTESLAVGDWARNVLRDHGEWFHAARLMVNMAIAHARLGQDVEALELFDQARDAYRQLGVEGEPHWLRVELNRAHMLRNLGRFDEAIQTSQMVAQAHQRLGQAVAAARAQQALAVTYFVLGRYNEALAMLDEVREVLLKDGRYRHAMLVELFMSDCLLQLRRFPDVLEKCRRVRELFSELGTRYEVGQAILNEACAYTGLERYADAYNSLAEARQIFEQEGNEAATADVDLQVALVSLSQGQPEKALELALACAAVYQAHDLPVWQARAYLVAARAALALGAYGDASHYGSQALEIGETHSLPDLTFPSRHLLGKLAIQQGDPLEGLADFEQAIQDLERLCGRLMVEFRASFIEDKERIYEDTVALCLDLDQPPRGLEYAERAKSRALLDLLAHRLDLSITARSAFDQPLVEELTRLRGERDSLYRRMEGGEGYGQRGETDQLEQENQTANQKVIDLEMRITGLWHKLLIRNADYARDAALWQVRTEPVQPYLEAGTLLLEYFAIYGRLVVFLVDRNQVQAVRLPADLAGVKRLLQLFWLNLRAVPRSAPERVLPLATNAQGVMQKLYQQLLAPFSQEIDRHPHLVIVPHATLHYLPFQALYDGQQYLLENHEISYLPGSSLLRYCREARPQGQGLVAVGHSNRGRLPYTVEEARSVAGMYQGRAILEDQATLSQVRQLAPGCRILHLAAHGDFRADNPLFSGLALQDGWLTTLDVFNMRLATSLVTLSACQTGRSVVGGGDELFGLMRSFLAAGAASLVSTLWAVEDQSTAQVMDAFYTRLAAGESKAAALRQAQLSLLQARDSSENYSHPYFWAPFSLVGDSGIL